jgi:cytochrome c
MAATCPTRLVLRLSTVTVAALFMAGLVRAQALETTTVWSGVYAKEQAARGKDLYANSCAACHGDALQGRLISDSSSPPPLKGERFLTNWTDLSLADLQTRVQTSMPPDTPGSLKAEEYIDILAFVLEQNAFPAGEPLPSDANRLKAILIKKDK